MSNYPETIDIFVDRTGLNDIASSDPNVAYEGIETTQGLLGALGSPQSWSTTLMVLLKNYRRDMRIEAIDGSLYVRAGAAALENTDASNRTFRENVTDVLLSAGEIDTGAMAEDFYYVYLTGGTATTTSPIQFSLDPIAPAAIGTASYKKAGWFYNEAAAALAVTFAGDIKVQGGEVNEVSIVGAVNQTCASASFIDLTGMQTRMVTNGRRMFVGATVPMEDFGSGTEIALAVNVDGTNKRQVNHGGASAQDSTVPIQWEGSVVAGTHVIKLQWKRVAGSDDIQQNSGTYPAFLTTREL